MKAKIKPRINTDGRTRLENVIPLSTPFTLFIDPSSACNFKCIFCPTGDSKLLKTLNRWQGVMSMDLFKKIIDDLDAFDKPIKVARLYKDGEPLMNKNFHKMVAYAKKSSSVEQVDTTTNGALLTKKISENMIGAGIDRINISVNGISDKQFLEFTKAKVNFKQYVENIKYLYSIKGKCEICIKIPGDNLSSDGKKKFYSIFGNICDRIFIENFAPCWPEFDVEQRTGVEIKGGIYQNKITKVMVCPYIFYSMSINSDGTASLCFLDWSRKLIVGDARKESVKDIWNGEKVKAHRISNLRFMRNANEVCATCGQLTHCMPDNIDKYSKVLLERVLNEKD